MAISLFDIFSIGIGPSSSHAVGPMRAALAFLKTLKKPVDSIAEIQITLYGSLAFTCKGHGTDRSLLMGLEGEKPDTVDPDSVRPRCEEIQKSKKIKLLGQHSIPFDLEKNLILNREKLLEYHSNGIQFVVYDSKNAVIAEEIYYSVGGGFIVSQTEIDSGKFHAAEHKVPYPFQLAADLMNYCKKENVSIAHIMMENEKSWRSEKEIRAGILRISEVMLDCIERGCHNSGILEGGLKVRRRAPELYQKLQKDPKNTASFSTIMNWLNTYAIAVNEENAASGRVVTAPTNGAAGIIPAVLKYYLDFCENPSEEGIITLLLTSAAIGILYKQNASISGAEMGCQGEVGVACSMAAGGLTAALGGDIFQVENAAEIGMEHNLGLTCDPIGGLVQIPCIERNAMGAVKAVNATYLALAEKGEHKVSLDMVINTMREIGMNMNSMYKETSKGGLAVNVPEC